MFERVRSLRATGVYVFVSALRGSLGLYSYLKTGHVVHAFVGSRDGRQAEANHSVPLRGDNSVVPVLQWAITGGRKQSAIHLGVQTECILHREQRHLASTVVYF